MLAGAAAAVVLLVVGAVLLTIEHDDDVDAQALPGPLSGQGAQRPPAPDRGRGHGRRRPGDLTWVNPQPQAGDTYRVRVDTDLGQEAPVVGDRAADHGGSARRRSHLRHGDAGARAEDRVDSDRRVSASERSSTLKLEFAGEWFTLDPDGEFVIGRTGDLDISDNQFLHRHFLKVTYADGFWWLANVGSRLSATVSSAGGTVQSWLSPGARIPIVFEDCAVVFTAGPTTYEVVLSLSDWQFTAVGPAAAGAGETTITPGAFTPSQRLVIIALAEPLLRRDGVSVADIPSSGQAANFWLDRPRASTESSTTSATSSTRPAAPRGLRAGGGKVAANRRGRLVEYAVSSRFVTRADLELLEAATADCDD